MRLRNKNVLIIGYGETGKKSAEFLKHKKANVFVHDTSDCDVSPYQRIEDELELYDLKIDFAIISPGVNQNENELCEYLIDSKVKIYSEIEFASYFCKGGIIAITGTNGKTTTTALVEHILLVAGLECYALGNIGRAFIEKCEEVKRRGYVSLECSSFQLENTFKFRPKISAVLNFSADHLSRHKTMENYFNSKCNIFKMQRKKDILVLNYDDEKVRECDRITKARVLYFSAKRAVDGAYLFENKIYFREKNNNQFVARTSDVKLLGMKNLENVLAATAICCALKICPKVIRKGISSFSALPHRLQTIKKVAGVNYINDSKATNIDSTLCALNAIYGKITLLLGGQGKGQDFSILQGKINKNVKNIICFGEDGKQIFDALSKTKIKSNLKLENNFTSAFDCAVEIAKVGESVLLSPACASFDEFKNYEDRGNAFAQKVNAL